MTNTTTFPLPGMLRASLEGQIEFLETTVIAACRRTISGETEDELKQGTDPVQLLLETSDNIGQCRCMLKLDKEAREQ